MAYCPKCGKKVTEDMVFCPNCGTPLRGANKAVSRPPTVRPSTREARETREKQEKREKGEKREKQEKGEGGAPAWRAPLIAGLVLVAFGFFLYLETTGFFVRGEAWPLFLIVVGIVIIAFVAVGMSRAKTRHPQT